MILAQKISGGRGKRSYHHRRDEKRANLEANRSRYRQAEYPGTSKIIDEFCIVSGYPRRYAIRLLGTSTQESRWRPLSTAGGCVVQPFPATEPDRNRATFLRSIGTCGRHASE